MQPWIIVLAVFCSLAVDRPAAAEPAWLSSPVKEWVDKARAGTTQVSIEDLKAAIDDDAEMVIIDVREPNEYAIAHIPEAVNIPRGLIEFSIWSIVPNKDKKIFVYCKTGVRAALATKTLNDMGYKRAVAVATGGAAWVRAGYPVQTSISDEEFVILPAAK